LRPPVRFRCGVALHNATVGFDRGAPRAAGAGRAAPGRLVRNLLWIERRKCLLVVHADTAFAVIIIDVHKRDVADPTRLVTSAIATALADEHLPTDTLGPLDQTPLTLATTASRRVLGLMNERAQYRASSWLRSPSAAARRPQRR